MTARNIVVGAIMALVFAASLFWAWDRASWAAGVAGLAAAMLLSGLLQEEGT